MQIKDITNRDENIINNKDLSPNDIININQAIIKEQNSQIEENKKVDIKEKAKNISKRDHPCKGVSIFNRIINSQIRKQIEYYFSDKNYYQDSFLLDKAAENQENCKIIIAKIFIFYFLDIDLKIIMGFNKIKSITDNPLTIYEAMKESDYVEFNQEKTKIRKKNIHKEFLIN